MPTTGASRTRSTTSRSTSRRSREPDALRLLKEDHARVEALLEEFEKTESSSEKHDIATRICEELRTHARLEETLVYPALRDAIDETELLDEALVEHETAKDLIAKIERSGPSDERFDALVTVLGEYVRHHVKEEEGELFKQARKSALDLEDLAQRMLEFKGADDGGAQGEE